MLASIIFFAPMPLLIETSHLHISTLALVGLWYTSFGLSGALYVQFNQSTVNYDQNIHRIVIIDLLGIVRFRYYCFLLLQGVSWLAFAFATRYTETSVVLVVYEYWPACFAITYIIWRRRIRSAVPSTTQAGYFEQFVLLVIAGVGVSLAVLSESGNVLLGNQALIGLTLAVIAMFSNAIGTAMNVIAGRDTLTDIGNDPLERSSVSIGLLSFIRGLTGIVLLSISLIYSPEYSLIGVLLGLSLGLLHCFAVILFQVASHLSALVDGQPRSHIISIFYGVPILGLISLWISGRIDVSRPDLIIAGAAGVVVVNMIMHLDPEGAKDRALGATAGHGYRAIVLSLWICGVIVAFREDWMPEVWVQSSVVEYWGIVGVCATVFVLIMSFRQSRLNERRTLMDEMTLRLHAKVSELAAAGSLRDGGEIALRLRELDTETRPARISKIYLEMRSLIRPQLMEARRAGKELAERASSLGVLMADINVFTNLRQQGRNFAELAVMTLFASLTVLLALFVRPEGNAVPFSGFVNDVVTMVLAAAFAFLVFDLVDKRREADAPLIQEAEPTEETANSTDDTDALHDWHLALHSRSDPTVDRWISSLLGVAVVVVFVFILYFKWLVV